jgi:hypothetical protein
MLVCNPQGGSASLYHLPQSAVCMQALFDWDALVHDIVNQPGIDNSRATLTALPASGILASCPSSKPPVGVLRLNTTQVYVAAPNDSSDAPAAFTTVLSNFTWWCGATWADAEPFTRPTPEAQAMTARCKPAADANRRARKQFAAAGFKLFESNGPAGSGSYSTSAAGVDIPQPAEQRVSSGGRPAWVTPLAAALTVGGDFHSQAHQNLARLSCRPLIQP